MKSKMIELGFDELPTNFQEWARLKISQRETILFCAMGTHSKKPAALIVTDYRLLIRIGDHWNRDEIWPQGGTAQWENGDHNVTLERIFCSWTQTIDKRWTTVVMPMWVEQKYTTPLFGDRKLDPLMGVMIHFHDEITSKKLATILERAVTEAKVRQSEPLAKSASIKDIGDQLVILVELLDKGHLTTSEFEAAKKKLLDQ